MGTAHAIRLHEAERDQAGRGRASAWAVRLLLVAPGRPAPPGALRRRAATVSPAPPSAVLTSKASCTTGSRSPRRSRPTGRACEPVGRAISPRGLRVGAEAQPGRPTDRADDDDERGGCRGWADGRADARNIRRARVLRPRPATERVITTSSGEVAKANTALVTIPGRAGGRVMRRNMVAGTAPRLAAARSALRSTPPGALVTLIGMKGRHSTSQRRQAVAKPQRSGGAESNQRRKRRHRGADTYEEAIEDRPAPHAIGRELLQPPWRRTFDGVAQQEARGEGEGEDGDERQEQDESHGQRECSADGVHGSRPGRRPGSREAAVERMKDEGSGKQDQAQPACQAPFRRPRRLDDDRAGDGPDP